MSWPGQQGSPWEPLTPAPLEGSPNLLLQFQPKMQGNYDISYVQYFLHTLTVRTSVTVRQLIVVGQKFIVFFHHNNSERFTCMYYSQKKKAQKAKRRSRAV